LFRCGDRFQDNIVMGRQAAHWIGRGSVSSQQKSLATATTEIAHFLRAAPAGFLHPGVAAKGVERRRLPPNRGQGLVLDTVKMQPWDDMSRVARQHFPGWGDTHVRPRPPAHAGFGLLRKIVHLHEGDLHGPAILRTRFTRDLLRPISLCPGRHQRTAISQCPSVVLRVGQFQSLRTQLSCLSDELRYMVDVKSMKHNIQRQRKTELLDEAGNSKFLTV
jgi:hypothetical protein